MLQRTSRPQLSMTLRLLVVSSFAFLALWLFPQHASAHIHAPQDGPTFRVNAGFDSRYRDGSWVPLQIMLNNDGPDFTGKISINVPAPYSGQNNTNSLYTYQSAVSLPSGAQKQVTLDVPFSFGAAGTTQNINVDLLDNTDQKISTQSTTLRSLGPDDIFIGVLSDQSTGFGPISQIQLPNPSASIFVEPLSATATANATIPAAIVPEKAEVLQNFNVIILDYFTSGSLSKGQIAALQSWVNQGGKLITVGGPEWRRTLSPLPADLLPVGVTGIDTLPAGTHLLPIGGPTKSGPDVKGPADTLQAPVKISTATPQPGSTVLLASGNTPLIVQSQLGQGQVYYLAFDPTLDPIAGWSNAPNLWKGLLFRSLGDKLLATDIKTVYPTGLNQTQIVSSGMDGLLQSLFPNSFPSVWLILFLLLGYVAMLGPVRLLLVRITKRRDWSWRIVLSTIVVFSLLSYGLAIQQKGTSIISSSISVMQLNRPANDHTTAHVTTSIGVFVPSEGNFQVHVPGDTLVQPISDQFRSFSGSSAQQPATITSAATGTDVKLPGVEIWTVRSLVSTYNTQVQGDIISHLSMQNGTLMGTVSSTLPYTLSDVYVLIGNQYQPLGRLGAGETKQVSVTLNTTSADTQASGDPTTLADQIAISNNLSAPYGGSYSGNPSPQTPLQRHMAMLATLSGEYDAYNCGGNNYCYAPARYNSGTGMTAKVVVMYSGGGPQYQLQERDPLLLAGAPATLIGWADNQTEGNNKVTINGNPAAGTQETLVQAPLDINFSGSVNLPSTLVTGQLVDVQNQGNNILLQYPGIYTMTTGSMTFEFTLPNIPKLQASSMAISEPANILKGSAGQSGTQAPGDVNHLNAYLYNWQTSAWDSQSFSQYTLSVANAQPYVNAQGRVLLQFANQDSLLGTTLLSRPALQLQGTVSR